MKKLKTKGKFKLPRIHTVAKLIGYILLIESNASKIRKLYKVDTCAFDFNKVYALVTIRSLIKKLDVCEITYTINEGRSLIIYQGNCTITVYTK